MDGEVPEAKKIDWTAVNTLGWLAMLIGFILLGTSLIRAEYVKFRVIAEIKTHIIKDKALNYLF